MSTDAIAFDDSPADFPRHLRDMRARLGLSQERLAEALGVSFTTVNRWEAGRSRPTTGHRRALARLAHIPTTGPVAPAFARSPAGSLDPHLTPRTTLPLSLTRFIGRAAEMAEAERLLGGARLLTLTGAGGTGKTRLALETARRIAAGYDAGVTLVELASLSDPSGVPGLVAGCFGLPANPSEPLAETIGTLLGGRRSLLLLDNCEHLLDACAGLAHALLSTCPGLTVLATSREPLHVPGEAVYHVPPLRLPGNSTGEGRTAALPAFDSPPPEQESLSESEVLFLDRARARRPDFVPDPAALAHIASICRRLDGLPLAIELAAAHAGTLSVAEIAARLDDRFRLLGWGSRTAPARHQTLHAAIDWGHALLTDRERQVFAELSVFAGSFDLAAGEAVCRSADTVAVVERLVDASMLVFHEIDDGARYRYLESLHAYAAERLAERTDAAVLHDRHAAHYREAVRRLGREPHKSPEWMERVQAEIANIRAALGWLDQQGERAAVGEMAAALAIFWRLRGLFGEGRVWCERAIAADPAADQPADMWALHTAGLLAREEGDGQAAISLMSRAVELARQARQSEALLTMLPMLAYAYHDLADWRTMTELCREALDRCGHPSDPAGIERRAAIVHNLGIARFFSGANGEARALFQEELEMARRIGAALPEALALTLLGAVARIENQDSEARRLFGMALDRWTRLGFKGAVAIVQAWLADLRRRAGDQRAALALAAAAIAAHQDIGARLEVARDLVFVVLLAAMPAPEEATALVATIDILAGVVPVLTPPALDAEYRLTVDGLRRTLGPAQYTQHYQSARFAEPATTVSAVLAALHDKLPTAGTRQWDGDTAAPDGTVGGTPLSVRERSVLMLLASGATNKEIAAALAISPRTVERHIANLYAKLGARGRADAIAWAHANHLSSKHG